MLTMYDTCAMQTNNIANQTNNFVVSDSVAKAMNVPRAVVGVALDYPDGHVIPFHSHPRAQLLHAVEGVMTVTTEKGTWVVPPQRGVWIPATEKHQIATSGQLLMRTLYIQKDAVSDLPEECCVVNITPLLKELILHMVSLPTLYPLGGPEERVVAVIFDQIRNLPIAPLNLPIPRDSRLNGIYEALIQNPGNNDTLSTWGYKIGASERTLARLFRKETGMSFLQWRRQFKVLQAVRWLAGNKPVTSVAIDLGYDSVSAFINMFKKTLGGTPKRYFNQ